MVVVVVVVTVTMVVVKVSLLAESGAKGGCGLVSKARSRRRGKEEASR